MPSNSQAAVRIGEIRAIQGLSSLPRAASLKNPWPKQKHGSGFQSFDLEPLIIVVFIAIRASTATVYLPSPSALFDGYPVVITALNLLLKRSVKEVPGFVGISNNSKLEIEKCPQFKISQGTW